jgi:hypothetical protein
MWFFLETMEVEPWWQRPDEYWLECYGWWAIADFDGDGDQILLSELTLLSGDGNDAKIMVPHFTAAANQMELDQLR